MIKVSFKRPSGFNTESKRRAKEIRTFVTTSLIGGLNDFQRSLMDTPVYTGRTLANYRWALGSPVTSTRAAIANPALPGVTSDLPLGTEPRRASNAELVNAEFEAVVSSLRIDPFQKIFLNNNLNHFSDIEYGVYARNNGQESRTPPGGMTRRGETAIQQRLGGLFRLVS